MSKYEIMIMLNPKSEDKVAFEFMEGVFKKSNIKKSEKLDLTDLAYPINKSTKAHYFLFELESESSLISEFTRRANINKNIWRFLVINLDTERGYNKPRKKRYSKKPFVKKDNRNNKNSSYNRRDNRNNKENSKNEENKSTKRPYTRRKTNENNLATKTTE